MRKFVLFVCYTSADSNVRYVSELLYIHSKLMIVDDRRVIVSIVFWTFSSFTDI